MRSCFYLVPVDELSDHLGLLDPLQRCRITYVPHNGVVNDSYLVEYERSEYYDPTIKGSGVPCEIVLAEVTEITQNDHCVAHFKPIGNTIVLMDQVKVPFDTQLHDVISLIVFKKANGNYAVCYGGKHTI